MFFSHVLYIVLAFSPLVVISWGDTWNDPQIFLINVVGILLFLVAKLPSFKALLKNPLTIAMWVLALFLFVQGFFLNILSKDTFALISALAIYGVVINLEQEKINRELIAGAFVVSALLQSALVIFQFFFFDPLHAETINQFIKWRASGTMGNPNRVAHYLGLVLVYLFTQDLKNSKINAALFIISAAFVLTISRLSFVALFFVIIFLAFKEFLDWKKLRASFLGGLAAILAVIVSGNLEEYLKSLFLLKSVAGRINQHVNAFELINATNFIWGIGHNRYQTIPGVSDTYIHNDFLTMLVENGLIGFIVFILIIGLSWKLIFSKKLQNIAYLIFLIPLMFFDFPLKNQCILSSLFLLAILK